jgi:hypothetical protein
MSQELRAMTLGIAIEYAKSLEGGVSVETVIEAAKKFEKHITGTGFESPPPGLMLFGDQH